MLKSTYKPSANLAQPLPPGWTEHTAPTGHTYYYNAETKESTYKRPGFVAPPPPASAAALPPSDPRASFQQYSSTPNLSDPAAANAWLAQYGPQPQQRQQNFGRDGRDGGRDGQRDRPRPQPMDKPKSKVVIPGCEPWILVYTKYGRRFAYNPVKNASYWRIPEKVMKGILELDIKGIREKAGVNEDENEAESSTAKADDQPQEEEDEEEEEEEEEQQELGSDYEEVEVTDDEDEEQAEGEEDGEHRAKRQRTEEPAETGPVEFSEADIAFQLQAMGEDYGLDPGEYDDGDPSAWPEGAEGMTLSEEDARELFKDLLNDYGINPFSPWEKLLEEGRIVDDSRYTVLDTTRLRKEVWEEWSREGIQRVKEARQKEEKKDPRIGYMAFLQEKASPKLYWPEFKRKYKKEAPLRDSSLNDRDREKLYRDYINKLKVPTETRKKDLTVLLKSIPAKDLNNKTLLESLPTSLLVDLRYISVDPQTRDPMIAAYIQGLGPPPDAAEVEEDEAARKSKEERRKREKALREREDAVAEQKRKQARQLAAGKAALREEEREIQRAMQVDKRGLQSQLEAARAQVEGANPPESAEGGASS